MKAKLAFSEWDDEAARSISFEPGDPVPDRIAAKVGDHVLSGTRVEDDSPDGGPAPFDGEAFDAAVAAKADELAEDRVKAAVEDQRNREAAAYDALDVDDEFDPSGDGVKAGDVKSYLEGLDRDTVAGSREFERVSDAEKAGANRSSALVD